MTKLLYFAYGSNMSSGQMLERCPDSRVVGSAFLPNQRISFPRFSKSRGCAVAGFSLAHGQHLWGVLYELTVSDIEKLDMNEGHNPTRVRENNSYNRISVDVFAGSSNGVCICAFTYEAIPQSNCDGIPSRNYLTEILKGAREHGLPEEYILHLEKIETGE